MKGDLTGVVAGDEVIELCRYGGFRGTTEAQSKVVERTTTTQVVLADGRKFSRDGRLVGGDSRVWVWPVTPENVAEGQKLNTEHYEQRDRSRYRRKILEAVEGWDAFQRCSTEALEAACRALSQESGD